MVFEFAYHVEVKDEMKFYGSCPIEAGRAVDSPRVVPTNINKCAHTIRLRGFHPFFVVLNVFLGSGRLSLALLQGCYILSFS